MKKMVVNWALCDGNGLCAQEAPEIFHLDDKDEMHLRLEDVTEALADQAARAVDACPKAALSIVNDDL